LHADENIKTSKTSGLASWCDPRGDSACQVRRTISVIFGSQDQDVVETHYGFSSAREMKYISQHCCGKTLSV